MNGLFIISLILTFYKTSSVSCHEEYEVIIIGLGPSGTSAVVKLLENGIDDILILEAEPRVGGRINTVNFEGRNIDLGAEWCHGEKNNIVYETLAKKNLLNLVEREGVPDTFHLSSRENVSDDFSKQMYNLLEELYFDDKEGSAETHESLGSYVQRRFKERVVEKFGNDTAKLKTANLTLRWLSRAVLSIEGAFSWYDTAAVSSFETSAGYLNWGWKNNGYKKFLDILTRKYPNPSEKLPIEEKTLLNKEVIKITVNDSHVDVLCSDRSTYRAKHVIFTPSLGVLKEKATDLFSPRLPDEKIAAIEKIGFGAVMKVFLKYDKVWWGNTSGFNFLWTEEDRLTSKTDFPEGPSNSLGESWIIEIYSIFAIPNSNILLFWFTGEMVPIIEKMDENVLLKGIDHTVKKFLGDSFHITEPRKLIRTNWYTNSHFKGTYSFASVNATTEDVINLVAPINNLRGEPLVLFAGEATNTIHHSTVHGAVETGYREANRLVGLYKKNLTR